MSLIALIPAHNEAASITATIASLHAQTSPPDAILVICDNCTDETDALALGNGAQVMHTVGNTAKKAGALNQALDIMLPVLDPEDRILVMDADSMLDPDFLATAHAHLDEDPGLGGVGGTFAGGPGGGLLGTFQRNEYARYARDVRRLGGKALVLTGTATVFESRVLREVAEARRTQALPDKSGQARVYDTHVLTEDNEISLALMHLGYRILAPVGCTLTTEVMPTWRELAAQRLRWKRGALENLFDYGLTRVTAPYWGRQVLSLLGVLVTLVYLASIAWGLVFGLTLHAFWLWVSLVFVAERVVTVRSRGWGQMALAAVLVVEMAYDVFLQAVQARAFALAAVRAERRW